jgi:uncharacterized membrane protein
MARDGNDYKRQKICEDLMYESVDMEAVAQNVDKKAIILADLDTSSVVSMPDVSISLTDKDQAMDIKAGQRIKFTGSISGCSYVPLTGTLFLYIEYGRLGMHY